MKRFVALASTTLLSALLAGCGKPAPAAARTFPANGVVLELKTDGHTAVIAHEEIPGYMAAMTMTLPVRDTNELVGLQTGDAISFRLNVTEESSWIDQVKKTGTRTPPAPLATVTPVTNSPPVPRKLAEILAEVSFTNQSGQAVKWSQFDGHAVALTFFFTRCPLPEYCPRLMKNFSGATRKLAALPDAPTNWHFVALTFDPEFDRPPVLRAYAGAYGADSNRWSFLVTSTVYTARIAKLLGLTYEKEGGTINHDFRTVIIDAAGSIQTVWPIGGDTTDQLVSEIIKAARATAP